MTTARQETGYAPVPTLLPADGVTSALCCLMAEIGVDEIRRIALAPDGTLYLTARRAISGGAEVLVVAPIPIGVQSGRNS